MNNNVLRLGSLAFELSTLSLSAHDKGEDAYLVEDNFIGVADGSTPLGDQVGSGRVRRFTENALLELRRHAKRTTEVMFRETIVALKEGQPKHDPISCTVATARSIESTIGFAVLGDCAVVVETDPDGKVITLRDDRVDRYDAIAVEELRQELIKGTSYEDARAAITPILVSHRRKMNTQDGYWIIADDPQAADHVLSELLAANSVRSILLCTDGFSALVETFHVVASYEQLLHQAVSEGLVMLGNKLRELEQAERSLVRFPRLSRSDDATALMLVRIS